MMEKDTHMKIWRGILPIMATFMICGLICLLSWQWFVVGCMWWECAYSSHFNSREIQIPREYFPSGAVYSNLFPDYSELQSANQREVQTIYWGNHNNSSAGLEIARYPGTSRAQKGFALGVRTRSEMLYISSESSDLVYRSNTADQLFVGCGKRGFPWGPQCVFIARYDEDLITLSMFIDKQMTIKEFERIIIYLDTVAARRLGH